MQVRAKHNLQASLRSTSILIVMSMSFSMTGCGIRITSPPDGSRYESGAPVELKARRLLGASSAHDFEWNSSLDGDLGSGDILRIPDPSTGIGPLSAGDHTIEAEHPGLFIWHKWKDHINLTVSEGPEPEPVTWARSYGGPGRDTGWSILATTDGGYLVAGTSTSFDMWGQLWLLKLNQQGDVLWQKMYGQISNNEPYPRIQETADGGFVVSHQGWGETCVLRLTITGTVTWSRAYELGSYFQVRSMALAADGSIFLAGSASPLNPPNYGADAWVMRLNASGDVIWGRRFGAATGAQLFYWIAATGDGGCVAIGYNQFDPWIVKIDASGNSQWQHSYTWDPATLYILSILQTTDGGYLATGRYHQTDQQGGNINAWLLRLDSSGNTLWQRLYGDSLYGNATSALEKRDGGFAVTGSFHETGESIDFWLFSIDPNGGFMWQQRYGGTGPEYPRDVVLADDGGFALVGTTSSFGAGDMDVWVVKVAGDGSISDTCPWSTSTGAPVTDAIASSTTTNFTSIDLTPTVTLRTVTPVSTQATIIEQCPAQDGGG